MATKTSSFGVSKREGHDSSRFYNSKLYNNNHVLKKPSGKINTFPAEHLNKVYCKDSRELSFLPDNCLHLMVTSPPYNVGKEYDDDLSLEEYLCLIKGVMKEIYRVLVPGGRACINIANLGRKPYIPLNGYITQVMLEIGFLMRGEIIWNKAASSGTSTAWGSWCSAANPTLRDVHEYIMVFSKESFSRINGSKDDAITKEDTITKEEFLEFTKSIWTFNAESAKRVNHPAPFPVELPYRLIQLYTFKGDVVIDPFCGSGTTCIAAIKTGRGYVGVDNNEEYVNTSLTRIQNFVEYGEDVVYLNGKLKKMKEKQIQLNILEHHLAE